MGRKHRGKKAVKQPVKETVKKDKDIVTTTVTTNTVEAAATATTSTGGGGAADGVVSDGDNNTSRSSTPPPPSPNDKDKYMPLFLRRPISSPSEQPSRFNAPPIPSTAPYGYGYSPNGFGGWPMPAAPPEMSGGLPTISWLCSCELCVNSVQEFIAALNSTNGQYAACIATSGPVYNELVAAGVHLPPTPAPDKVTPTENGEGTDDEASAASAASADTPVASTSAENGSVKPSAPPAALNGYVTTPMPFYPVPVAANGFMGPDGIMYFNNSYWPMAYANGPYTMEPEAYNGNLDMNGNVVEEEKLEVGDDDVFEENGLTEEKTSDESEANVESVTSDEKAENWETDVVDEEGQAEEAVGDGKQVAAKEETQNGEKEVDKSDHVAAVDKAEAVVAVDKAETVVAVDEPVVDEKVETETSTVVEGEDEAAVVSENEKTVIEKEEVKEEEQKSDNVQVTTEGKMNIAAETISATGNEAKIEGKVVDDGSLGKSANALTSNINKPTAKEIIALPEVKLPMFKANKVFKLEAKYIPIIIITTEDGTSITVDENSLLINEDEPTSADEADYGNPATKPKIGRTIAKNNAKTAKSPGIKTKTDAADSTESETITANGVAENNNDDNEGMATPKTGKGVNAGKIVAKDIISNDSAMVMKKALNEDINCNEILSKENDVDGNMATNQRSSENHTVST